MHSRSLTHSPKHLKGIAKCSSLAPKTPDLTHMPHSPVLGNLAHSLLVVSISSSHHVLFHSYSTIKIQYPSVQRVQRIRFNSSFCFGVKLVGNFTLYVMIKLPLVSGFLLSGMPRFGYTSLLPGCVGPALSRLICFLSIVVTVRFQPVRASLRSRSTVYKMSSPSRVKSACGFCRIS